MANSINTNIGAQVALQNLNRTNSELQTVQKRISTGLNVADAKDDGAAFAVAQGLRSDIKALGAVNSQLGVAKGALDVALAGATSVSDKLGQVRSVVTKLADQNLTTDQRNQYIADYDKLKTEILSQINATEFNGKSLVSGGGTSIKVISDVDGNSITLAKQDLKTGAYDLLTAITTSTSAQALLTATGGVLKASARLGTALNSLASDNRRIEGQISFNNALIDATEAGLGAVVDADLAKESARLQALQIKQQLGAQALGIANQAPQTLLSLFR